MISVTIQDTIADELVTLHPEAPIQITVDKTITLESGELVCKHLTKEEAFEPGDEVTIVVDSKTFHMIVDNDKVETIAVGVYNHTIALVEETAKLIKGVGADRYFSTSSTGAKITYKTQAEILRDTIPLNGAGLFTLPTATNTLLDVDAAEKKYENQHLLKSLQELFRSRNAVPRLLRNGQLTFDLYIDRNNPITFGSLFGQTKDRNLQNYAQSIYTKGKNLIYEKSLIASGTFFPSATAGAKLRSSSNKWDDLKAEWQVDRGIRKIVQAKFIGYVLNPAGTAGGGTIDLDITDYIVAKDEWDGLEIGSSLILILAAGGAVQRNTFYFNIGDTNILNIASVINAPAPIPDFPTIQGVIRSALFDAGYAADDYQTGVSILNYRLQLFYQPYFDADMTSEKYTGVNKRSTMLTNQKDKVVDLSRYGDVLKGTANMMANSNWAIREKVLSIDDALEIGDYTSDGYEIIKTGFLIFQNKVEAIHELTKNFANLDAQVSVQNRPVPYTISRENTESNFVFTEYIELSNVKRTTTSSLRESGRKAFMNGLDYLAADDKPIYNCEVKSVETSDLIGIGALCMGTSEGIRVFAEFKSPHVAGNQIIADGASGFKMNPILYTDEGGGMVSAELDFVNDINYTDPSLLPVITSSSTILVSTPSIDFNLQPNEILGYTGEFLFKGDDKFIIAEGMATNNSLVKELALAPSLSVFISGVDTKYDIYDKFVKETITTSTSHVVDKIVGEIDVSAISGTDTNTWAIGDTVTGELYFAVNFNGVSTEVVYFNYLTEMPDTIDL